MRCFAAARDGSERRRRRVVAPAATRSSNKDSRLPYSREKSRFWASLAPPLIVAVIAASGFAWLAFANLDGSGAPQPRFDHSAAIQALFFRGAR